MSWGVLQTSHRDLRRTPQPQAIQRHSQRACSAWKRSKVQPSSAPEAVSGELGGPRAPEQRGARTGGPVEIGRKVGIQWANVPKMFKTFQGYQLCWLYQRSLII